MAFDVLPVWGDRPLADIQRSDVRKLLARTLGSRLRHTGIDLGLHHPFDDAPLKLVDLCPDLPAVVAAIGRKK